MASGRRRRAAAAAGAALVVGLLPHPAAAAAPAAGSAGIGDPYFPLYGNGGYDALHYDISARYDPGTDMLVGDTTVRVRALLDLRSFNLDLVGLSVRAVSVDGVPARWSRTARELVVTPRSVLRRGRTYAVRVRYDGVPRQVTSPTLGRHGFMRTPDGALAVGEPEAAAFWFPANDHPQDKATFGVTLTVPQRLQALSNGLPGARTVRAGWASTTWRMDDPMATYLAFLAVGRFDVRRSRTASGLPVIDAVDSGVRGELRRRVDASLRRQSRLLAMQEQWFGPYPFRTVGAVVDDLELGFALENQSRPVYTPGNWVGASGDEGDAVVVHELAHQWFGNSVGLQRWSDIWLNEGLATYAEWLWMERTQRVSAQQSFDVWASLPASDPFWRLDIADPGPQMLFDYRVYVRGAMTMHALRRHVGTPAFFRILRAWAREHRGGTATTGQLVTLAERVSGRPVAPLLADWLSAGKPRARSGAALATASPQAAEAARTWGSQLRRRLGAQAAGSLPH